MPIGQMTIFYCGKVNVYDDVPADKVLKLLFAYLEVIVTLLFNLDLVFVSGKLCSMHFISWIILISTITNCHVS